MAAVKKKVVTKDDLRRFMKEKQTVVKGTVKKIEHPLAKYNSLNQLMCVLCNSIVKNDLLWSAHILSKQHKERVSELKTQGPAKPDTSVKAKRKGDDDLQTSTKKLKTGSAEVEIVSNKAVQSDTKERAKAALLAGYSSSSSSSDESDTNDDKETTQNSTDSPTKSSRLSTAKTDLPDDFFDHDAETEQAHSKKMSEVLPEGFFDDPKLDAKVRNVEYKDKDEEQWDLFQKAIKEEAQVSEVIMEEEDEQVNIDRNIDEIDDQIHRWQEVENLHVKKETIAKSCKPDGSKDNVDDEVDDEELDSLLNWRAKKSLN
ncbi:zinc finger protein 830 [Biomphalaria glabrata]|uniref:Zinc finger protein 830 n=1 Tax=Biomphalaria glabrata TaxID=6526 RepID=A0A9W2ZYR6_BIOGL|nr:zinc finger protein 830-like [Biomphalaria glabrata]KAI8740611.1 zinc finger protein 830-like [Biomphalaria glabrata]